MFIVKAPRANRDVSRAGISNESLKSDIDYA